MRICIDTNIYSALKKGNPEIRKILENADEIYIPSIVLGELYAGFQMGSKLRKNIKLSSINTFEDAVLNK